MVHLVRHPPFEALIWAAIQPIVRHPDLRLRHRVKVAELREVPHSSPLVFSLALCRWDGVVDGEIGTLEKDPVLELLGRPSPLDDARPDEPWTLGNFEQLWPAASSPACLAAAPLAAHAHNVPHTP